MEFFFVIFYKKVDKVSIEMLYLVNKILLLEQLVLGSKEIALIYFAFLHDFTAFADISVIVEYLFLGANMFSVFIIEHIAGGDFFYGFGQQFPFRKNKVTQEQYDGLQREIIETEERLKSLEEQANQSAVAGWKTSDMLGCGTAGVEQAEVLRDKSIIEEKLKKEQGRYETLLDMRMNNEIPREVFSRKQQEVEKKIAELEQQMMQYGDVKPATEADVSGKLENLRRLMEQPPVPEDGEFSEEDIDKYVFGVRVYEDRFEWLLNLSPEARGELDDAGSPVYFTKLTVTPDDERAWFRMHPQWSKSNKYAELEAWIYI